MYKTSEDGEKKSIDVMPKEEVELLLRKHGIKLKNKIGYDYVFAANMGISDYLGESIEDDKHLALFVKNYVDDPDGYPELPFTRFYADCIGTGTPIN